MGLPSSLRPHRWGPLSGGGGQWSFLDAVWAVFLLAVVIFLALVFTPLRRDPLLAAAGAVPRCTASEVDLLPCEEPCRNSRLSHEMNYYDAARARHRPNRGGAWESQEGGGAVGGRMGRRRGGAAGGGDAMEGRGEASAGEEPGAGTRGAAALGRAKGRPGRRIWPEHSSGEKKNGEKNQEENGEKNEQGQSCIFAWSKMGKWLDIIKIM